MYSLAVPILTASSVGLFIWAVLRAILVNNNESRRLKARLKVERDRATSINRRLASIRAGHDVDRFEAILLNIGAMRRLDALLQQSIPNLGLKPFGLLVVGAAFATGLILYAIVMVPAVGFVGMVLGGVVPFLYLMRKRISRQRLLDDQLPDAMDFLGRALRAGHSLSSGIQMMGNELPQPIAGEFAHAYAQHSLGVPMETVLKNLTIRVESTDFAFFVTSVLIQRQTGGDLSEVLNNIGDMIRQRIRLQQQVKAKTAEGRFTGYLLTAFPAVMFVLLFMIKPDYAQKLTQTELGQKMLVFAFIMQVCGLIAIRRITQVRV